MAEQLEDDAGLIASEADEAELKANLEKQTIIEKAQNLGITLQTQ